MITFWDCVQGCLDTPAFLEQWARLRGVHLPKTTIDRLVDEASGNDAAIARLFLGDVLDLVYLRLPAAARRGAK